METVGFLPQGPWEGLTCLSEGFHGETAAEDEKKELRK
jgi:hypothetical protein